MDVTMKSVTIDDFMYRKQHVLEKEWQRIDENLRRHQIDRYQGVARFITPTRIAVGDTIVEGTIVLIATGSSPYRPSTVPFDDECVCDSDTILQIGRIPASLAVGGAGVIGCEYASLFAPPGLEVHLVAPRSSLLPHMDRELARLT